MKIKLKEGPDCSIEHLRGNVYEALIGRTKNAILYDEHGCFWEFFENAYTIVEEKKEQSVEQKSIVQSIRDLCGQEIKSIEFK